MARKIKINKLPAGYHMMPDGTIMRDSDHKMMAGGNVLRDVSETKDFNLEAEGGETIVTDKTGDGLPEHYAIEGKRHSQGGVKMKESAGSFIFSDTPKMKIGKELNAFFNKSESKSYTPAELAKQYIDMNDDKRALMDKNSDKLEQSTAALNMFNKTYKLGGLAMAQEAKKNFPDGIPQIASLYAQLNGIATSDNVMPGGMQQAKYGAQVKMYQVAGQIPQENIVNQEAAIDNALLDEIEIIANSLPMTFKKGEKVFINGQPYASDRVYGRLNPFVENYNVYSPIAGGAPVYIPSDTHLQSSIAREAVGDLSPWLYGGFARERAGTHQHGTYGYNPVHFTKSPERAAQWQVPAGYNIGRGTTDESPQGVSLNVKKGNQFYIQRNEFSDPELVTIVDPYRSRDQELKRGSKGNFNPDMFLVRTESGTEYALPADMFIKPLQTSKAGDWRVLGVPTDEPGIIKYFNSPTGTIATKKSNESKDSTAVTNLQDLNKQLSAPQDTVDGESFKYGGPKYEKGGPITERKVDGKVVGYRYNGVFYHTREAAIAQRTKDQATASSTPAASGVMSNSRSRERGATTPAPRKQEIQALDLGAYEILSKYKAKPNFPQGWNVDPNTTLYANTQALDPKTGTYENAASRVPDWLSYWKDRGADVSGFYDASGNLRQLKEVDPSVGDMQDYITQYNNQQIDKFVADRKAKGLDISAEEIARLRRDYTFADPTVASSLHTSKKRDSKLGEFTVNRSAFEWEDLPETPPATPPKTPPVPPLEPPTETPPTEPPYTPPFPQDEIAVASAFANNAFINKYPSWTPQVQLPRIRPTFLDPRYANAAAQSSAQMAMDASNVFAGNESVARAMNAMTQGQSADKQIGNISNIGMQNVGIANQMAGASAEMAAREQMINTQLQKTGYDQNVLAADNYDKERSMNMLQNTLPAVQNLMTNWALAKSFPYMTPNYRVDTRGYGTIVPNPGAAKTRLTPGSAGSAVPTFAEYRNRFPDVSADKVAEMYSKQYISGSSQTPGVDASTMDPRMMMMYMQMMRNQGR